MIGDLKPHAAYKKSGQDWLGSIPAHWGLLRAKRLFREVDERSTTGKEELLSVSHITGVTPRRLKTVTMFLAESNVGHKLCRPGDLVINTLWAWMGALGVTRHTGLVSPAYGVYRPLSGSGILPAYADHLLRTPLYAAEYQRRSTGVNSSRLRLYPEQFLRMPVLVPPLVEQAAIVRFLDWANGRLERAIRAKRKVIALLTAQKQAIIHRAVTHGLDPSAARKPSGVSWLGNIPQHWGVTPIGAATTLIQTGPFGSQLHSHEYVTGGTPVINPSHMLAGRLIPSPSITIGSAKVKDLSRHTLRAGDIVIARRGDLGRCALVVAGEEGWVCGTGSLLVRCNLSSLTPVFFQLVFSSSGISDMLSLSSIGATMANLNAGMVARQRMPVPPVDEQNLIFDSPMMRIATYNINGMNARLPVLLRWLDQTRPDVACLQELKSPQERFPQDELRALGYEAIWHGQKSWNGVAILSRGGVPKETRRGLPGDPDDTHSRYLEAEVGGITVGCLYLPNGNPAPGPKFDYKLRWLERFIEHASQLTATGEPIVLTGDYNVIPTGRDVYKPERWVDDALFRTETREAFERLMAQGWTDALRRLHPDDTIYTYWDYFRNAFQRNAGLRIDHFLLSAALVPRLRRGGVDTDVRGWEKSSDHAPVWIELECP